MRHIKVLLEYDGTNYHGWQSQVSGGTIQDTVREKISGILGEEVKLTSASRTDAGVHALGQVAVFGTESRLTPGVIKRALNAKLPPDIRILEAEETIRDFHPRYDAVRKSYFYIISNSRERSAFLARYFWNTGQMLDLERMKHGASFLTGTHDFSAFRGSGCGAKTTVRTVHILEITGFQNMDFMTAQFRGRFIRIRIEANAFLRHMVRNIVGTLVQAGRGEIAAEECRTILESCDRTKAGPTAPAQGLFLEEVIY